jgi:hypothetical protein
MNPDAARSLSEKMIVFLETGTVPDGLFQPEVLLDLNVPTWRLQARGAEDLARVRKDSHPWPGAVTRWRTDPTPGGFVLEFEERWHNEGQEWCAREMMRMDVVDDRIAVLTVYCTGDWDQARQREHAASVALLRP